MTATVHTLGATTLQEAILLGLHAAEARIGCCTCPDRSARRDCPAYPMSARYNAKRAALIARHINGGGVKVARNTAEPGTPITIRRAGTCPDTGRQDWWVRDHGCDVTVLQQGPYSELWLTPNIAESVTGGSRGIR